MGSSMRKSSIFDNKRSLSVSSLPQTFRSTYQTRGHDKLGLPPPHNQSLHSLNTSCNPNIYDIVNVSCYKEPEEKIKSLELRLRGMQTTVNYLQSTIQAKDQQEYSILQEIERITHSIDSVQVYIYTYIYIYIYIYLYSYEETVVH